MCQITTQDAVCSVGKSPRSSSPKETDARRNQATVKQERTCTCSKVHDYKMSDQSVVKTADMVKCIGVTALGLTLSLIEKNTPMTSCLFYANKDLCEQPESCMYKCPTDTSEVLNKIADVPIRSDSLVGADTETKPQEEA